MWQLADGRGLMLLHCATGNLWPLIGRCDAPDASRLSLPLMATRPRSHHIGTMQKTHPHAEATYRVISFDDGSFGVKVEIPETYPTTVSKFATEADAAAWITKHQRRVQSHTRSGIRFSLATTRG